MHQANITEFIETKLFKRAKEINEKKNLTTVHHALRLRCSGWKINCVHAIHLALMRHWGHTVPSQWQMLCTATTQPTTTKNQQKINNKYTSLI